MAEAVLFNTAASIIKSSGSLALQEIGLLWSFKDELKKLGNTVSTIQAVLLDAEEKQAHNHLVKDWLGKLKDAMYEADDLLDDYSTELLRRQVMTRDKIKAKRRKVEKKRSWLAILDHAVWTQESSNSNLRQAQYQFQFLRKMAQPYDKAGSSSSKTLLSQEDVEKMSDANLNEMLY